MPEVRLDDRAAAVPVSRGPAVPAGFCGPWRRRREKNSDHRQDASATAEDHRQDASASARVNTHEKRC